MIKCPLLRSHMESQSCHDSASQSGIVRLLLRLQREVVKEPRSTSIRRWRRCTLPPLAPTAIPVIRYRRWHSSATSSRHLVARCSLETLGDDDLELRRRSGGLTRKVATLMEIAGLPYTRGVETSR